MAPNESASLDTVLNQITTSNNVHALNHTLRNSLPRETRDTILASTLGGGQDPLSVLDMRANTLGALYILAARLSVPGAQPPDWGIINAFCQNFIPDHARLAPDRVTQLAVGIKNLAYFFHNLELAIPPLFDLVSRYAPDLSYLTTIHPIFISTCVATRRFSTALPILRVPILDIDTNLSDLHFNDNLTYHYAGGIALAALEHWAEAEEFLEICVTSPGTYPAALQLEALKKLKLIQLISKGTTTHLPKYTHPVLIRMFRSTHYNNFVNSYPQHIDDLRALVSKEQQYFSSERNLGLIQLALSRAPRWSLKKLTGTYLTLGLADIGREVKINSEDEVRRLILNMIETSDISAQISADGTVIFSDPPPQFTKAQVDRMLLEVQRQTAVLSELDADIGGSKEFLNKVVKSKDESAWGPAADEEIFPGMGAPQMWEDTYS